MAGVAEWWEWRSGGERCCCRPQTHHDVHLIQYDASHTGKIEAVAVEKRDGPANGRDHDVDPLAQHVSLSLDRPLGPTRRHHHPHALGRHAPRDAADLHGELGCRAEDQHPDSTVHSCGGVRTRLRLADAWLGWRAK